MNRGGNFIPGVIAIAMGIGSGYYIFQPALQEMQQPKTKSPATKAQEDRLTPEIEKKDPSSNPVTVNWPDGGPRRTWFEQFRPTRNTAAAEDNSPVAENGKRSD